MTKEINDPDPNENEDQIEGADNEADKPVNEPEVKKKGFRGLFAKKAKPEAAAAPAPEPEVEAEPELVTKKGNFVTNKISDMWNSKALSPIRKPIKVGMFVGNVVTWLPRKITVGAWKANKPLGMAVGAAFLAAATYGGSYGWVVSNDQTSFLNWPASQGQWKGDITRFSKKGTWPCVSYEGNLRTGEAADQESFSVRQFSTELIDAIQNIPQDVTEVTLVYRDNGISQESFENSPFMGCIQDTNHTAVGIHYTAPNGQRVDVGLTPN